MEIKTIVISRFVDPKRIKLESKCFEISEAYIGERVEGVKIHAFELVLAKKNVRVGVEKVGELKDRLGIVIFAEVDEDIAASLEQLIAEILNRVRGLRYDFRKDKVVTTVSKKLLSLPLLDCIGELLLTAFLSLGVKCEIKLIADESYNEWLEIARKEYKKRMYAKEDDEVDIFYVCRSCQFALPNHSCIITPQRPSPCGTTYSEALAAEKLGVVGYYSSFKKGRKIGEDEYEGVNELLEQESEGKIKRAKIHSVIDAPLPAGLYTEVIIFYIPEEDGFGIVDRNYRGKTPIGLRFDEMEKLIIGRQVSGFVGESFAYLKSKKFLSGEGGWSRVSWVSDGVRRYMLF